MTQQCRTAGLMLELCGIKAHIVADQGSDQRYAHLEHIAKTASSKALIVFNGHGTVDPSQLHKIAIEGRLVKTKDAIETWRGLFPKKPDFLTILWRRERDRSQG